MLLLSTRTKVSELGDHAGTEVVVTGWVSTLRKQKAVQFIVLRDETGDVQLVHERATNQALAAVLDDLTRDSVIAVKGLVVKNEKAKLGGIEVVLSELSVLSRALELPIGETPSLDVRLDWRHIDLRSRKNQAIFRAQTIIQDEFRQSCLSSGFTEINSPKLMASPSESKSELFEVGYFDRKAYLAQSPQFYKQMGIASGFRGVFETGPVFRANPSFTSRHDTEFTSLDVEFAWVDSHHDVMAFEEFILNRALSRVSSEMGELISDLFEVDVVVPSLPFPRIPHAEAIQLVLDDGYRIPRDDGDLDPEAERRLARIMKERYGHEFVFVTDYPTSVRPFYHMRYEDRPTVTKSFDLLWKGLEVTTGAQREHRADILEAQVVEKGHDPAGLEFYLNFFKFGCPPHGGFGLGLTRLLMLLLNVANVREVTYIYRGPNRLTP